MYETAPNARAGIRVFNLIFGSGEGSGTAGETLRVRVDRRYENVSFRRIFRPYPGIDLARFRENGPVAPTLAGGLMSTSARTIRHGSAADRFERSNEVFTISCCTSPTAQRHCRSKVFYCFD